MKSFDEKTTKIAELMFKQNGLIQKWNKLLREKPLFWRARAAKLKLTIDSIEKQMEKLRNAL